MFEHHVLHVPTWRDTVRKVGDLIGLALLLPFVLLYCLWDDYGRRLAAWPLAQFALCLHAGSDRRDEHHPLG